MSNGDSWREWVGRYRKTLPGASQEEIERRAKIRMDAAGGQSPGAGPRGMPQRGGGGMPAWGSLSDEVLKLWRQMISGIQTYRKAWGEVQGFATEGREGQKPDFGGVFPWEQWKEKAKGMGQRGMEYLRTPFNQWGR